MPIKRVPACSFLKVRGRNVLWQREREREMVLFADLLDSLSKPLSPAERGLAQISIPCWVKAPESADLNLFDIRLSSGCFLQEAAAWWRTGLTWQTDFVCVWFDLMAAERVRRCKQIWSLQSPFSVRLSEQETSRDKTRVNSHWQKHTRVYSSC